MCMNTLEHDLLCLFSPYLMFFIIDYRRGLLTYQIRQLPYRARGDRTHVHTYRSAWTVLYTETFFLFPLIERLVCTMQCNQFFDALIKYVRIISNFVKWPIKNSLKCMVIFKRCTLSNLSNIFCFAPLYLLVSICIALLVCTLVFV